MVKKQEIDAEFLERARWFVEQSPDTDSAIARSKRFLFSEFNFRWATEGPANLLAILESAEALENETKEFRRRRSNARRQRQRRLWRLADRLDDHPSLQSSVRQALDEDPSSETTMRKAADSLRSFDELQRLCEAVEELADQLDSQTYETVAEAVSEAEQDIAELPSAMTAVELGFAIVAGDEELSSRRMELDQSPARLDAKKDELATRTSEVEGEVSAARQELEALRDQSAELSAEKEHLEHVVGRAASRLRDLESEAKVLTAHVEGESPAAARRLYHLFREATHYREYRRQAEETEGETTRLEEELQARTDEYNELVDTHNQLVNRLQDMEDYLNDLHEELDLARNQNDQLLFERNDLWEQLEVERDQHALCSARGRPISALSSPSFTERLSSAGLFTYGDLADCTSTELQSIPGIGPAKVDEIRQALAVVGIQLRN